MKFHRMIQLKFVKQLNLPHWMLSYSVPSVTRTTVKTVGMLLIAILLNVLLLTKYSSENSPYVSAILSLSHIIIRKLL